MLSKTHIINGATCALLITSFNSHFKLYTPQTDYYIYIITGSLLGSILPDIDHHKSWISKLSPIPFYKIFKHRGITHNKIFILISFLIGYVFKNVFLIGLFIGLLSHSVLDGIYTKTSFNNKILHENICFYVSWFLILTCLVIKIIL